MVALCMAYGLTIGVVSMFASGAVGVVSIVGAAVLAIGWSVGFSFTRQAEKAQGGPGD